MCLKLVSEEFNNVSREEVFEQCLRIKHIFVVIDSNREKSASDDICKNQQASMKCFVRIRGDRTKSNSHKFLRS